MFEWSKTEVATQKGYMWTMEEFKPASINTASMCILKVSNTGEGGIKHVRKSSGVKHISPKI